MSWTRFPLSKRPAKTAGRFLFALLAFASAAHAADFPGASPFVAGDGNGGFVVSYVADDAFRFVTIRGAQVSAPRDIAKGNVLASRANFPSIAVRGKTMVTSWLTRNGHGSVVHVARSKDGGATWTKAISPHPNLVSEFGFVSLTPEGDVVWLDGRKLKGGIEGEGDMELRYASLPSARDVALDARVCDCCQTAMAMTSSGPIVAYRDRTDDEIRDIAVIRKTSAGWSKPKVVHADGWKMPGCPVNGPQLDANGKRVVIAWFTMHPEPHVFAAFSNDAGATFGKPIRIDVEKTAGRADIALLPNGSAAVIWVEQRGEKTMLFARRVTPSGSLGNVVALEEVRGFPRVAVSKENTGVVWAAGERVYFRTIQLP